MDHLYPRDTVRTTAQSLFVKRRCHYRHFAMSIEIALEALMNDSICRRVLIYDEAGFSRVCSAILAIEGFGSDIMDEHHNIPELINRSEVGVFVTSYPFGALLLDEVRKRSIPAIVLYDNLDERFISTVLKQENLYCMIKPLDYTKFKGLVKSLLSGEQVSREEYGIV